MSIIAPGDLDKLVFIDETGSNAAMAPSYGWAPRLERAGGKRPKSRRGKNVSIIGALTLQGLTALMTIEGGVNGDAFLTYVRDVLVPTLKPGQVVVMDNVSTHKVPGILDAIQAAGCTVWFLPPYSPQFNPIELCWNKFKYLLRRAAARTTDAINAAVGAIADKITPADAHAWFNHCGYGAETQLA